MKKAIRVHKENTTAISDALGLAQFGAVERVVSYQEVLSLARGGESRLERLGIPKVSRAGAVLFYYQADLAAGYALRAETTRIVLERLTSHWYLSKIERIEIYPGNPSVNKLIVPKEHRERVIAEYQKKNDFTFSVEV